MVNVRILDCTLRDGGYYNEWDFDKVIIEKYLKSMELVGVDAVELGLRSLKNEGFKGPCAFTTENFVNSLDIPKNLLLGVMINASELISYEKGINEALEKLFLNSNDSKIKFVRIACHIDEFEKTLSASSWLKEKGYIVGYNLMQVADKTISELEKISYQASLYPIDVLYFADSLGSLTPKDITRIVKILKKSWKGDLGIHTHDNMSYALANSIQAYQDGVTWIDSTVTGMGRGPGNCKTETLIMELKNEKEITIGPLLDLIDQYFSPMQNRCGWGTNVFYHLAGKYSIHPTFIQEMLSDSRYSTEDILAVIEYLKLQDGQKFSRNLLNDASNFYNNEPKGTWSPSEEINNREVLILGTGEGVKKYKEAIEEYIKYAQPYVIALNTDEYIDSKLINVRAACHPIRLMADCRTHLILPQPLVTPFSMLSKDIKDLLIGKEVYDFGIIKENGKYKFEDKYCQVPKILVVAYALAIATSGNAKSIFMAGFDGYPGEDSRNDEMNEILDQYRRNEKSISITAITPTKYRIPKCSVYKLIGDVDK